MLGLIRNWRRRRTLERHSIDDRAWHACVADITSFAVLNDDELRRLRDLSLLFLHEKIIEPAVGFEVDDAMRLRIAAMACRPILELGIDSYNDFVTIIVYPDEFVVPNREYEDDDGVVHVGDDVLSGEAWERGPVLLGWREVLASGQGSGFDVVAHEFAHKLDLLDGTVNGLPPLHRGMLITDWTDAFRRAYEDLELRIERGEEPWLDPYAAEDPGEFFAVCTEMFFDLPGPFREEYPDVYAQLAAFYRQDPAGRQSPVQSPSRRRKSSAEPTRSPRSRKRPSSTP